MDPREILYLRLLTEIERGCHNDLLCYCQVREKVEDIRGKLGPVFFDLFVAALCNMCVVPSPNRPTAITPTGAEAPPVNPPVLQPPVLQQPPVTRSQVCPMPTAADVSAQVL